jgi:hypothetical protein
MKYHRKDVPIRSKGQIVRYETREYPCKVCGGSGLDQKYVGDHCQRCYSELTYPKDMLIRPSIVAPVKRRWRRRMPPSGGKSLALVVAGLLSTIPTGIRSLTCAPTVETRKNVNEKQPKPSGKKNLANRAAAQSSTTPTGTKFLICARIVLKERRRSGKSGLVRNAVALLRLTLIGVISLIFVGIVRKNMGVEIGSLIVVCLDQVEAPETWVP